MTDIMRRKNTLKREIILIIIELLEKYKNMWRIDINWDIIIECFILNTDVTFENFFTESN